MEKEIKSWLRESAQLKLNVAEELSSEIQRAAEVMQGSLEKGGKVVLFGNGGSASQAQHTATELVHQSRKSEKARVAIPAMVLGENMAYMTAVANDWGFERVFERQVEALVHPQDVVIALTTSGNSLNVLRGLEKAKEKGARTICLSGKGGGKTKGMVDVNIIVPSENVELIQEAHLTILHILCNLAEQWEGRDNDNTLK